MIRMSCARVLFGAAMAVSAVFPLFAVDSLRPCDNGHSKLAEKSYNGNYYWADEEAFPQSDADYVSKHAIRSLTAAGHDHTFGGRSLEIASGGYWIKGNGTETFSGAGGLVLSGSYLGDWGFLGDYRIKGSGIRVTATNPAFGIYPAGDITAYNSARARIVFAAPFSGDVGAALSVGENVKITAADGVQTMNLALEGDCSAYRGMLEVRAGGVLQYAGPTVDFPAEIAVRSRGEFVASNAVSVAQLTLEGGAALTAWSTVEVSDFTYGGGTMRIGLDLAGARQGAYVFGSLHVADGAKLPLIVTSVSKLAADADLSSLGPVLKMPTESGLTPDDISLVLEATSSVVPGLPNLRLTYADDGQTGLREFSLAAYPVVTLAATDANNTSSAFTNTYSTSHWSDGLFPHSEADYLVQGNLVLRTDKNNTEIWFAGCSLVLDGGTLGMKGPIRIADLKSAYTGTTLSTIKSYGVATNRVSGGTITLNGPLSLLSAPYSNQWKPTWGMSNGGWPEDLRPRYTFVDSALSGTATLNVRLEKGNKDEDFQLPCYWELTGDNSAFTGRISIESQYVPTVGSAITNDALASVLVIRSAENLGGTLPAADTKSITLSRGALWARETLTLADANRGIDVAPEGGRFIVSEGETLTVLGPLTQRGEIRKEGAGTLALGGALAFGANRDETPGSGPCELRIFEGAVQPAATNSFDGFTMNFSPGTRIEIDADAADAGLAKFGLRNVKSATPFMSDGKIGVRVKSASSRLRRVAICTVSGSAPDLTDAFDVTTNVEDCGSISVAKTTNADGTVTYFGLFRKGLLLIFR